MINRSGSRDAGGSSPQGDGANGESDEFEADRDARDDQAEIAAALRDVEREMQEAPAPAGEVERLRRELADLNDRHLRLVAEFDNYRRRTLKEKQEMGVRAQATLATSLLESLDDLARVTSLDTEGADAASFVEGVELLSRKLLKSLAAAGLEVLNPLNEKFDPAVHEAVATEPAESAAEEDTISSVFQAGYLFKGLLLRPARVAVRKWNG